MASEEPDGGNLLVRIWEGPGRVTGRGYSTTQGHQPVAEPAGQDVSILIAAPRILTERLEGPPRRALLAAESVLQVRLPAVSSGGWLRG